MLLVLRKFKFLLFDNESATMEITLLRLIYVALLVHLAAGLDTKMFQLTMPNVRPYRVSFRLLFAARNVDPYAWRMPRQRIAT